MFQLQKGVSLSLWDRSREKAMNKNEKNSIRKYDGIARNYESTFEGKFTARYRQKILELCDVPDGGRVLDVGCGNGSLINAIRQKGRVEAHGIDISPNMIEECRKRYAGIHFEVSTGEKIGFADDYFDVLTICCALHHLNNPQKFFEEAHRILKRGGLLIVGEPWNPFPIKQMMDYILSPLLRAGDNKTFTRKRLHRLFEENGFSILPSYEKDYMQVIKAKKG